MAYEREFPMGDFASAISIVGQNNNYVSRLPPAIEPQMW